MLSESRLQDAELYARICLLIDEGALPVCIPEMLGTRYGSNLQCHCCDQPVNCNQVEYLVGDPGDSAALFRLHLACYVLWRVECVKRMRGENYPADKNGGIESLSRDN